jgi:archaellum biogenesis ATPase FlaH
MLDTQILSAWIAERNAYDRTKDYIKDSDCTPAVGFWLGVVREYYTRDARCSAADYETIRSLGAGKITNPKHSDAILTALESSRTLVVSPSNIIESVLNLRRYNLSAEFAAASMSNDRKKANVLLSELNEIWDQTQLTETSEIEYAKDWAELDSEIGNHKRVPVSPGSLNSRIGGGLLPGHHVVIFGRTEIGKSCLTISLAAQFLRIGQKVLYVGNEDSIHILKSRMRLSLLNQSQAWVDSHPKKAIRLLNDLSADRLTMVHMSPGSISELEGLVAKHSPSVLILDQIRNLSGNEDGMTQKMEHNAIRFRSILSRNHLIGLSVTQAGDRSQGHNQQGPLYLSPGDVDSSRVGLPGTADLMLGVGATQEMLSRGLRMISFAKNKLSSEPQSREPLCVRFDLSRSIVTDG